MMRMKKLLFPFLILLFFSCSKSRVTEQQRDQYAYCQEELVAHKKEFIALGKTPEMRDSLEKYAWDIEHFSLEGLIDKYEVEDEQIVPLLYSICQKAEMASAPSSEEEMMYVADSLARLVDSLIKEDSLRKMKR